MPHGIWPVLARDHPPYPASPHLPEAAVSGWRNRGVSRGPPVEPVSHVGNLSAGTVEPSGKYARRFRQKSRKKLRPGNRGLGLPGWPEILAPLG